MRNLRKRAVEPKFSRYRWFSKIGPYKKRFPGTIFWNLRILLDAGTVLSMESEYTRALAAALRSADGLFAARGGADHQRLQRDPLRALVLPVPPGRQMCHSRPSSIVASPSLIGTSANSRWAWMGAM